MTLRCTYLSLPCRRTGRGQRISLREEAGLVLIHPAPVLSHAKQGTVNAYASKLESFPAEWLENTLAFPTVKRGGRGRPRYNGLVGYPTSDGRKYPLARTLASRRLEGRSGAAALQTRWLPEHVTIVESGSRGRSPSQRLKRTLALPGGQRRSGASALQRARWLSDML